MSISRIRIPLSIRIPMTLIADLHMRIFVNIFALIRTTTIVVNMPSMARGPTRRFLPMIMPRNVLVAMTKTSPLRELT